MEMASFRAVALLVEFNRVEVSECSESILLEVNEVKVGIIEAYENPTIFRSNDSLYTQVFGELIC